MTNTTNTQNQDQEQRLMGLTYQEALAIALRLGAHPDCLAYTIAKGKEGWDDALQSPRLGRFLAFWIMASDKIDVCSCPSCTLVREGLTPDDLVRAELLAFVRDDLQAQGLRLSDPASTGPAARLLRKMMVPPTKLDEGDADA